MFPDDCVQSVCDEWWLTDSSQTLVRGRVALVFFPYPEHKPHRLVPKGRGDDPGDHSVARYALEPFRATSPPIRADILPVAGLPLAAGETYYVQRGKMRPALIVGEAAPSIPPQLRGQSKWQTAPMLMVAPYFGVEAGPSRGGWPQACVDRIRRAEYPQYLWDCIPDSPVAESILRLDCLTAVGADSSNFKTLPVRLSAEALDLVDEWLLWLITGELDQDGTLAYLRMELSRL